ncbi:MAG TPA: FTR1 family protein [Solirubrobacteraceae bacterium]|nr:FTR1 family protein [Solirubrobacteraceae bacterium]
MLAVAVLAVVLGWHAQGGTPDPTQPGAHMSRTSAVIDSGVLVFREGLETILVLAAVMASFLGANRAYRKPVATGGSIAFGASIATWFLVVWLIGRFGSAGPSLQAATGIPAIVVLLIVMNWFFHRLYWTGWISHHHKRRRKLLERANGDPAKATMIGLLVLGFSSVYREGFEIVIFLQGLRETFGSSVVLEGVALGLLFTAAVGVLTFGLHQRLPYKRLLIITGGLLVLVLWVMVGEEVNEMQLAGWIATSPIPGLTLPGWLGTWLSIFPNIQTLAAETLAVTIVLGSYFAAQNLRVRRPRRQGLPPAHVPRRAPEHPAHARLADSPT